MKNYLIVILFLAGCDQVGVSEEDIKKYPEINVFVLSNRDFKGSHDMDLGKLHFSYQPKFTNAPIEKMDSIAEAGNWVIKKESNYRRVFLKEIKSYPADIGLDSLYVEFKPSENRLYFKWH
jgi:hypothetical protein